MKFMLGVLLGVSFSVKIKLREKRTKMRNVNRERLSVFQAKKLQAINSYYDLGIL